MSKTFTIGIIIISSLGAPLVQGQTIEDFGHAVFSEVERRLIRDYYHEKYGSIDGDRHRRNRDHDRQRDHDGDHGKQHKKDRGKGKNYGAPGNPKGLPPGVARKLARGGKLPPGIAKKNLPADLDSRLPPVRRGYERLEVDGRVVLVDAATDIIVDIIRRTEILDASSKADSNGDANREQRTKSDERSDDDRRAPKSEKRMKAEEEPWYKFW